MARYIYLIRHARPVLPADGHVCLGRNSDPPLCEEGKAEARKLAVCFPGISRIYSGTLKRTVETAGLIGTGKTEIIQSRDLDEIDVGEWEGKSFADIRREYPEIYSERGKDWSIPPKGGESLSEATDRMQSILMRMTHDNPGDITAVTSDGAIRALLWKLMHLDPCRDRMIRQPYGSITVLKSEYGALRVTGVGKMPEDYPSNEEIEELWDLCGTKKNVRMHCAAVSEACLKIGEELGRKGVRLSADILRAGALLHDTCREEGRPHAEYVANLLRERGYLRVANIVEAHQNGPENLGEMMENEIDEAQVLYLADKLIRGTQAVSLDERFQESAVKCRTTEAREMHRLRYDKARLIRMKIMKMQVPAFS